MIIGIGGISMAGKSTLAASIMAQFPRKKVCVLCQDDYIFAQAQIPKVNGKTDWENPASINFDDFLASLLARKTEYGMVIAEGLFAFYDPMLNSFYDKKIFIEITDTEFFDRKRKDTRWGIEPEWYIRHIWESYLKYGLLPKDQKAVLKLDGTKSIDPKILMNYLKN